VPPDLDQLRADLRDEQAALKALLDTLPTDAWDTPTSSPGWTVRHQVRHLAHGEELGALAASDPAGFQDELAELIGDLGAVERGITEPAPEEPAALVDRWWTAAEGLRAAEAAGPAGGQIDWITGPMSRASFLTARMMETFAHGRDVAEAMGMRLPATARLRHVAHLGVATRGFAFGNRGLPVPEAAVRVELRGPDGDIWSFGPEDAPESVRGDALDFCLLVTRRIHRADTTLEASGAGADAWLDIAQCFAGAPSDGPPRRASGGAG
jgi:uncharacterized protein (TIGR03084 family)